MYFESSSPCYPSVTSYLYTPALDLTGMSAFNVSYAYHMYGSSMGTMSVDLEISGNQFEHRTSYGYGVYLSSCDGNALNKGKVYNNSVSVGDSSTSVSYGFYLTSSSNLEVKFNSINVYSLSTSGRGIYVTSGIGNDIYNNNIQNVGPGYGIYLSSGFDMVDHNNYYVPNGNVGYFGSAHATLNDWQTATALDFNSYSVDPLFPSFTNLTTCNDTLDKVALYDSTVTVDITGLTRDMTPDIGAYEFEGISSFNLGSDTSICGNQMITLGNPNSPSTWSWNSGQSTNSIDLMGTDAGTYIATRSSICGSAIDTLILTQSPDPLAAIDTAQISYATVVFGNNSTDATSYVWDFGDGNTSTETNPYHIYTNGGNYTVTLTATGPCGTDVDTMVINLSIVGIDQISANIEMYPNPAKDVLNIVSDQVLSADIKIMNLEGKVVKSTRMNGTNINLNVSDLAKGLYLIKVTNEEGSSIQRLVIE